MKVNKYKEMQFLLDDYISHYESEVTEINEQLKELKSLDDTAVNRILFEKMHTEKKAAESFIKNLNTIKYETDKK